MAAKDGKVKIEKFNDTDFEFRKMLIENYLYQKNPHLPLVGKKPGGIKDEELELAQTDVWGPTPSTKLTCFNNLPNLT
jgi:hypothetical protein